MVGGGWDSSGVSTGGAGWLGAVCLNTHKEGLGCLPPPEKLDTQGMKMEVEGVG